MPNLTHDTVGTHFQHADPTLFSLWERLGPFTLTPRTSYFSDLCEAIIGQQLSEKVGAVLCERFHALYSSEPIEPAALLALSDQTLRDIGVSWSKVSFMKDLAARVTDGRVVLAELAELEDAAVIEQLVTVKGIGPWTAEMFLIFTLGREDVFSCGDGGLQRAVANQYGIEGKVSTAQLLEISQAWSPYRSYACKVLWKSLEKPATSTATAE